MTPPEPPDSGVYISPGQIYGELRRQSDILIRLTVQLERGRYEERLAALERWRWTLTGGAAAVGGAAGWLAQAIGG